METDAVQVELSHREVAQMFPALIDEELEQREALRLRSHLDGCNECRDGWVRYSRAVTLVRRIPRERAPESLASSIVRRTRRRRFHALREISISQVHYRVPYEVIIPILLGALVAATLILSGL